MTELTVTVPDWFVVFVAASVGIMAALDMVKAYLRWRLWRLKRANPNAGGSDE